MRALVTAVVGAAGAGACARAARRYAVADRLRTRARKRWFLPARIRRVVGAALGAAALDVDPEHACTLWAAGAAGATMLGAGVGGASVALGVLPILVVDGSTVDGGLREKV